MTKRFVRKLKKLFAVVAIFSLVLQNITLFSKFSFAQEATELISSSQQPVASDQGSQSPEPTIESSPVASIEPSFEPSLDPSIEPSPSASIESSPESTPSSSPASSSQQPVASSEPSASPQSIEQVCLTNEQITNSIDSDWDLNETEKTASTKEAVKLGTTYVFPYNDKVTVSFKCLPKDESLRQPLKIQQIKVSDLKLPTDTLVNGDYVWDITTGMTDGTFSYDVVLPKPENKEEVKVAYIEKSVEDLKGQTIAKDEVQTVESTKLYEEKSSVKVTSLDHFTVFFVTGGEDYTYSGSNSQPLNPSEINALSNSDDIRMRNDVEWPHEWWDYYFHSDDYLTFRIPIDSTNYNHTTLTFEWQKDSWSWFSNARLVFWDGNDWDNYIYILPDWSNYDKTFNIDVSQYINHLQPGNNFDFRFQAYGINYSWIDYISLNATQWDGSNLVFNNFQTSCNNVSIDVVNTGSPMAGTTTWELYYNPIGNPQSGTIVAQGTINVLGHNGVQTLTYDPQGATGYYQFKVNQRPEHPTSNVIWSSICCVSNCPPRTGTLQVYKNVDLNGDGDYNEAGETRTTDWKWQVNGNEYNTGDSAVTLPAGNYVVSETQKTGFTEHNFTCTGGTVNDHTVTVVGGAHVVCTFENLIITGSISGFKWEDINGNKIWDPGEPALANWEIFIDSNKNYVYNNGEPKTSTNASGYWEFTNLVPADYWVGEILKSDWSQSVPYYTLGHSNFQLTLSAGGNLTNNNFGNYRPGSITGYKWNDLNGDGIWQQPGEPSVKPGNLRIRVWNEVAPGQYSIACDAQVYDNGHWGDCGFMPGTYWVNEYNVPTDWVQTYPSSGAIQNQFGDWMYGPITINSGESKTADFGNFLQGQVSGYKWNDINGNGVWDENESAINGWQICINLVDVSNEPNCIETAENGFYQFSNLNYGQYQLTEETRDHWHQSIAPSTVLVSSGTVSQDNNFGNFSDPRLVLDKTNDREGQTVHINDLVTFTITLTNEGEGISYNTHIQDVQPVADYFEYLKTSGKLTKPDSSVVDISATGSNPYFWDIGDILPGETYTLTYQLKVIKDNIVTTHTNIANAEGLNGAEDPVYSNTDTSSFNIGISGPSGSYSGEVKEEKVGGVLGAKTGKILGAATGSPTSWLLLAIVLIGLGTSVKLYRKLKIKH